MIKWIISATCAWWVKSCVFLSLVKQGNWIIPVKPQFCGRCFLSDHRNTEFKLDCSTVTGTESGDTDLLVLNRFSLGIDEIDGYWVSVDTDLLVLNRFSFPIKSMTPSRNFLAWKLLLNYKKKTSISTKVASLCLWIDKPTWNHCRCLFIVVEIFQKFNKQLLIIHSFSRFSDYFAFKRCQLSNMAKEVPAW